MPKVKVSVKNNQKEIKVPVGIRLLIRRCCQAVLAMEQFKQDAEVSVSFVSNNEIRSLNKIYRNKDRVTDVLSFPLGENGKYDMNKETGCAQLGDVVISLETAMRQAEIYGHSLEREIGFLTVHSMLHLLGYDHEISKLEERIMREKEEQVLGELGISREETFVTEEV
ncbi:MAG: rRNA maturation RNase YbeY [Ruminococcus sp.]|nr:rRNA maturation RNase YbeY [Ruminococcus sp.]